MYCVLFVWSCTPQLTAGATGCHYGALLLLLLQQQQQSTINLLTGSLTIMPASLARLRPWRNTLRYASAEQAILVSTAPHKFGRA